MTSLIARSPAEGLMPLSHGTVTLAEEVPEAITSLMALRGSEVVLPEPNRSAEWDEGTALWSGRNQALLIGRAPGSLEKVAWTDQSDSWCVLRLEGRDASATLARLTPLDLRESAFAEGQVARSLLGHMTALFHRVGRRDWRVMVFRSMAGSAVHELERAMRGVAARSIHLDDAASDRAGADPDG